MIAASDSGTLEQLKELSSKRKAIEDSINASTFITEAIAREMSGGLTSRCEQVMEYILSILKKLCISQLCVSYGLSTCCIYYEFGENIEKHSIWNL